MPPAWNTHEHPSIGLACREPTGYQRISIPALTP